jgi:hypothetical protein
METDSSVSPSEKVVGLQVGCSSAKFTAMPCELFYNGAPQSIVFFNL